MKKPFLRKVSVIAVTVIILSALPSETLFSYDVSAQSNTYVNEATIKNRISEITVGETYCLWMIEGLCELGPKTWISSNPSVASVNWLGDVTAHKSGTVTIYCYDEEQGFFVDSITIKIVNPKSGSTIGYATTEMTVGDINSLWLENYNIDKGSVKWSSSQPSIVSVDRSGAVTAKKIGAAVISCFNRNGNEIANVTINVYDNPSDIPVKAKIGYASKNMTAGDIHSLWLEDSNVDENTINWSSTNTAIASIDQYGVVTANKSGTVNIICNDEYGNVLDSVTIKVVN